MSSEDTTAEKEQTEGEEAPKDLAAAAEDPVAAAAPPTVREVPAHLQRQAVRKMVPVRILLACIDIFPLYSLPSLVQIPEEFDIDSENSEDCYMCPEYAKDIFDYLKQREVSQSLTALKHNFRAKV